MQDMQGDHKKLEGAAEEGAELKHKLESCQQSSALSHEAMMMK